MVTKAEEIDPPPKINGPRLPWEREPRTAPSKPQVIEHDKLTKQHQLKEIDPDVVSIQCSLGQFLTNCRGIEISLHDLAGKELLRASTGTTGVVGFEGLKRGVDYIARINSDRYQGEIQIHSGRAYSMNGKQK